MAVVFTLVHTKQIRITIHKRNNIKNTAQTIQNTENTSIRITKTHTHTHTHYKMYYKQEQYNLKQTQSRGTQKK